ncbi:hypothetical protein SNK04_006125 [Fusarium graminearum]
MRVEEEYFKKNGDYKAYYTDHVSQTLVRNETEFINAVERLFKDMNEDWSLSGIKDGIYHIRSWVAVDVVSELREMGDSGLEPKR